MNKIINIPLKIGARTSLILSDWEWINLTTSTQNLEQMCRDVENMFYENHLLKNQKWVKF